MDPSVFGKYGTTGFGLANMGNLRNRHFLSHSDALLSAVLERFSELTKTEVHPSFIQR